MVSEATTPQSSTSLQLDTPRINSTGMERAERSRHLERGSLLPILPDDITTNLVLPRLSWTAMMTCAQLNRAWQTAVRSPKAYDLRVQASNFQTIVTIGRYECSVSLYDTPKKTWHRLPRPPFCHMLVARGCGCVTLQGKLYILGGSKEFFVPRNEVHVFDLAGQGRWKQCAEMKTPRKHFACAAYEGKIYVFGGVGAGNTAEVYDPDEDLWCDIAPMLLSPRIEHKVVITGDVFCVHMGRCLDPDSNAKDFAEIYDPRKDQWTAVANFAIGGSSRDKEANVAEALVVIDGRLHGILDDRLYVYEEPTNSRNDSGTLSWNGSGSWRAVQTISWDVFQGAVTPSFNPYARVAIAITNDGELLSLVFGQTGSKDNNRRWVFLESIGLGSPGQQLTWRRVEGSAVSSWTHEADCQFSPYMSSIAGQW